MTYTSYEDLEGNTLKRRDKVNFLVNGVEYRYIVETSFLGTLYDVNWAIFSALKLNDSKFCSKHYGYPAKLGGFPESRHKDYDALTRVALALFKLCDNYSDTSIWE